MALLENELTGGVAGSVAVRVGVRSTLAAIRNGYSWLVARALARWGVRAA